MFTDPSGISDSTSINVIIFKNGSRLDITIINYFLTYSNTIFSNDNIIANFSDSWFIDRSVKYD